jgi:hypothetical protein
MPMIVTVNNGTNDQHFPASYFSKASRLKPLVNTPVQNQMMGERIINTDTFIIPAATTALGP